MSFEIAEEPLATIDEGVWREYKGSEFKIAYATNMRFMRAKQRLEKPHKRDIENDRLDPSVHRGIMVKAMAEGILVDWRGLKGDPKYSVKLAEKALANDEEFREFVMNVSMELENFKTEEREHEGES